MPSRFARIALLAVLATGAAAEVAEAQAVRYPWPSVYDLRQDSRGGVLSRRAERSWGRAARPGRSGVAIVRGTGRDGRAPGFATDGNGLGSTGYGYGGDFSAAYPGSGATDGFGSGQRRVASSTGYGARPFYGASNAGYGGPGGFVPPIPPGGGLPVYVPGGFGPGPRIIRLP